MPKFITRKEFDFKKGIPKIVSSGIEFPYPGVSKIVNHAKESIRDILIKEKGSVKLAEKVFTKTENAGRVIHKQLENNEIILPEYITNQLGNKVADEVFCCNNLATPYNVMGFADSIWEKDKKFIPVENKTKSNPKIWKSHKKDCFPGYVMQLLAYTKMIEKNYGLQIDQMGVIIFFRNQSFTPYLYLLDVKDYEGVLDTFKDKLIEYYSSLES